MTDVSGTPPSTSPGERVRLEGRLDVVRASDASFRLVTDDGRVIEGRLVGRPIEELARFLNRAVVIFGSADFDAHGNMVSVEGDGFLPADNRLPNAPSLSERTKEEREEMARRLKAAIGT